MSSKKSKSQPVGVGMKSSTTGLGEFIRARRLELNLSQILVGERSDLPQTVISSIEIGTKQHLKRDQLIRLAKVLQCDPDELRNRMPKKEQRSLTDLGRLIRSRREELGLTVSDLASRMNASERTIIAWELRRNKLSSHFAKKLANALELERSDLVSFTGSEKNSAQGRVGQYIRFRRREMILSLSELARKLGVSLEWVRQVESGKIILRRSKYLGPLAEALQIDLVELKALIPQKKWKKGKKEASNSLGQFLMKQRRALGLSRLDFVDRAGLSVPVLMRIETGSYKHQPHKRTLDKIVNRLKDLGVSVPPELLRE